MDVGFLSDGSFCLDSCFKLDKDFCLSKDILRYLPTDKSYTHRALIISSMIKKDCFIYFPSINEDLFATYSSLWDCGIKIRVQYRSVETKEWKSLFEEDQRLSKKEWLDLNKFKDLRLVVSGSLYSSETKKIKIDCLSSATTARLMLGVLSSCLGVREFIVDGSSQLRTRPMKKLVELLSKMKACIEKKDRLPIRGRGKTLELLDQSIDQGSAQLKSAIILAGLNLEGEYSLDLPRGSRRSTEIIVEDLFFKNHAGTIDSWVDSSREYIKINQKKKIYDFDSASFRVGLDPSSLAYVSILLSMFLSREEEVIFNGVLAEEGRLSWSLVVAKMGFDISYNFDSVDELTSCKLKVRGEKKEDSKNKETEVKLSPISISRDQVSSLIDELPLIMGLCFFCPGRSCFYGVEALELKESNRIEGIKRLADIFGVECKSYKNIDGTTDLFIHGKELGFFRMKESEDQKVFDPHLDHRMIMTAAVCGIISRFSFRIKDSKYTEKSFFGFWNLLSRMFV